MPRTLLLSLIVLGMVFAIGRNTALAQALGSSPTSWPEFRGPSGQGRAESAKLPTKWDAETNITWRTEIPGVGWSSPVIVDGKVYLTTAVPENDEQQTDLSLRALCLDAMSGEILWNVEVFQQDGESAPRIHPKNSHASPTPVVFNDRVYVHFGHMGTACLSSKDGSSVWKNQDLGYQPTHGNGGSPVIFEGKLIYSIDGQDKQEVVALDIETGKIAWETPRKIEGLSKYFSFCTPLIVEVNGQMQVISPGSGVVMGLDPRSGDEIWRCRYGSGYSVVPRPIYANGLIYVCTGYDRSTLVAVHPDGKGDVTESHVAFTLDKGVPYNPSLVAVDDSVYMVSDNGVLSCLDGKTGELRWKERVGGNYSSSLLYAGGLVYLIDEAGLATVFRPGDEYDEVAKNDLGERTLASFGIDGNALLLRTEKALYRIEEK